MSRVKKIIAMLLVAALMVPSVAVCAATPSVKKTKIEASNVSVNANTTVTYTGKAQSVNVTVTVNGRTLIPGTDYDIVLPSQTNAGTYTLNIKIVGKGLYEGTVTKSATLTIKKETQKVTVKKKNKTKVVKYSKTQKKAQTFKLKVKVKGSGKIKYKSYSKKIKVSKKGRVLIAKGIKKGTYKIKVWKKKAKNSKNSKKVTIKIKIK